MKFNSIIRKFSGVMAAVALLVTTLASNATCNYLIYQEKLPENAKKLRKF